jgi:hypothetical protein
MVCCVVRLYQYPVLRASVGSDDVAPAADGGVVVTTGLVRPASAAVVLSVLVIAMPSSSLVVRVKCQYSLVPYIR